MLKRCWANDGAWGEEGRLFWMMEYLNHTNVHVLYGGISAYYRQPPYGAGYPVDDNWASEPNTGSFVASAREELHASKDEISAAVELNLCNAVLKRSSKAKRANR